MDPIQAIILGIVQGITEFIPVSSSGHLIFLPQLFGWEDQGLAFDVVVHLGTLLAVLTFFWEKLWKIVKSYFPGYKGENKERNKRLGIMLVVSIIPAGLVGFFFEEIIKTSIRSAAVVAVSLIIWGIGLAIADRYSKSIDEDKKDNLDNVSWWQVIIIGITQTIALIPGTSRSGITMTAGLFTKLKKTTAAEFSFLMSVPIIAMAGGLEMWKLVQNGMNGLTLGVVSAGFISSALSGFLAIWGLMAIIKKWNYLPFAIYRVVVGVLILLFLV